MKFRNAWGLETQSIFGPEKPIRHSKRFSLVFDIANSISCGYTVENITFNGVIISDADFLQLIFEALGTLRPSGVYPLHARRHIIGFLPVGCPGQAHSRLVSSRLRVIVLEGCLSRSN